MKFSFPRIITFIKENPEKVILWSLLATFIFLSSYLAIGWPKRKASFSSEKIASEGIRGKPASTAAVSVDFEGLLTRKPITYYNDFVQRNPFSSLPGVAKPTKRKVGKRELLIQEPGVGLICSGIVGTLEGRVAFFEGKEGPYKKGDEVEGWRIIKIDKEKVKLYNEAERRELILPLGGGLEERERARKRRAERRRKVRERGKKPIQEPGRFQQGFPPELPPMGE